MTTISKLLKQHNISISKLAKSSGLSNSQLKEAITMEPDMWSVKILKAFATALKIKPGELLDLVAPNGYSLEINDDAQMIQGVEIDDKETYQQIRFVVEAEHLEGWDPTTQEIEFLLAEAIEPNPDIQDEIDEIWGEEND